MAKHHIVQKKYLDQWASLPHDRFPAYCISENRFLEANSWWHEFWREDFNVLPNAEYRYLPEQDTAIIDTLAIKTIKNLNFTKPVGLTNEERVVLSHYTALQYLRTPRQRAELDKMLTADFQEFVRTTNTSPENIQITKTDFLNDAQSDKADPELIDKVKRMTEDEFKNYAFNNIRPSEMGIGLTNEGHSKQLLKLRPHIAEKLFYFQWILLLSPKDTSFITSDSPCYVTSSKKLSQGITARWSTTWFPLRPDICLYIYAGSKSTNEVFIKLSKEQVRNINQQTLYNSYNVVLAKSQKQLERIVKGFDHKQHKQTANIATYHKGPYTMYNLER
jgi:hypothetical protein